KDNSFKYKNLANSNDIYDNGGKSIFQGWLSVLKNPVNWVGGSAAYALKFGRTLPNSAAVVRGGTCKACQFENGSGVTISTNGTLRGVSVNSASGATINELSNTIRNNQIGVTTVRDVRALGGDVVPSPTRNNPTHATLSGITPTQAQQIFIP